MKRIVHGPAPCVRAGRILAAGIFLILVLMPGCKRPDAMLEEIRIIKDKADSPSEIEIRQGGLPVSNGDSFTFAETLIGDSTAMDFEIRNGKTDQDLILYGAPTVELSDGVNFHCASSPASPVLFGTPQTFTIVFQPQSAGPKTTTMTIRSNDVANDPYTISFNGPASEWSGIKSITETNEGNYPSMLVKGEEVYVAYFGGSKVRFRRSPDRGKTWETAVDVYPQTAGVYTTSNPDTDMIYYQSKIWVSYHADASDDSFDGAGIASSSDQGATWSHTELKERSPEGTCGYQSTMASDGHSLYVVYSDYTSGSGNLTCSKYYRPSTQFFWYEFAAENRSASVGTPSLTGYGGIVSQARVFHLYTDFSDGKLYISQAIGNNNSFFGDAEVTGATENAGQGVINVDSSTSPYRFNVVYWDSASDELRCRTKTGVSWSDPVTVDDGPSNVGKVSMATSGSNLCVCYVDTVGDGLWFVRSTDGGASWSTPQELDPAVGYSIAGGENDIAVSGSYVYICFYEANEKRLKLAKSLDGGATW